MKRRIIKLMTTCFAVAFVFLPSTQILAKSNDPLDIIRIQIAEDAKNKTKEKLTEEKEKVQQHIEKNTQKVVTIEDIMMYTNGVITEETLENSKKETYVGDEKNEETLQTLETFIDKVDSNQSEAESISEQVPLEDDENISLIELVNRVKTEDLVIEKNIISLDELKDKLGYEPILQEEPETISQVNGISQYTNQKVIFLAPSTQYANQYVINDTNEGDQMNLIMDIVEEKLSKIDNLKIIRNDKNKKVLEYIEDANSQHIDVYFSLHSNANKGVSRGPIVFAHPNSQESQEFANIVSKKLLNIYPGDRNTKALATNSKYHELASVKAPSIITELAFHDNVEDATWIMENRELIASQLVSAILEYLYY